jgi:hypothetical protein
MATFDCPTDTPSQALLVISSKTQQIVRVCGVVAGLFLSNPAAAAPANDKRTCANASGDAAPELQNCASAFSELVSR